MSLYKIGLYTPSFWSIYSELSTIGLVSKMMGTSDSERYLQKAFAT